MSTDMLTAKMLDAAGKLAPDDIVAYLKDTGWSDVGPYGELARIYRLQIDGQIYEAVIPIIKDVGDFRWRVIDLVHSLVKISGREFLEICDEISTYGAGKNPAKRVINDTNMIYNSTSPSNARNRNNEDRANVALAIKSCLDSLMNDATRCDMDDLARFIALAALAAEEEALASPGSVSRYSELREILRRSPNLLKH